MNIMDIHKIANELITEIERLEDNYQHYKKQYKKYYLLCCSQDRKYMRDMKKNSKKSLEEKKERAIEFIIKRGMREAVGLERKNTERRNTFSIFIPPKWEEIYDYKNKKI